MSLPHGTRGAAPDYRILCIGNRYAVQDDIGPRVHDALARMTLPPAIELVDGGLGGLNLLPLFEGPRRVLVVDTLSGFGGEGEIVQLEREEVAALCDGVYGHAAGLPYLLRTLALVHDGPLPEVRIVGCPAGAPSGTIATLARLCLHDAETGPGDEPGQGPPPCPRSGG